MQEWPGRPYKALASGKEEDRFTRVLAELLTSREVLFQTGQTKFSKPLSPSADLVRRQTQLHGDILVQQQTS